MPRPARPWFRFYVEAVADRKLLRLTPGQRWLWVCVLAAARQSPEAGQVLLAPGIPVTEGELAHAAGLREREASAGIDEMIRLGMLERDGETLVVTNWKERQFESDDVTARTAKHRSNEQGRNVPTLPEETPPETETETEPERARKRATPPPQDFDVDAELRAWAAETGIVADLEAETRAWLDWCEANGRTYKNVRAGWKTWMRRAKPAVNGHKPEAQAADFTKLADRVCPYNLCGGTGYVPTDQRNVSKPCRCRTMKPAYRNAS